MFPLKPKNSFSWSLIYLNSKLLSSDTLCIMLDKRDKTKMSTKEEIFFLLLILFLIILCPPCSWYGMVAVCRSSGRTCGSCSGMDARLLDAEPDSSVSGRVGAGLSSLRNTSRDAASVRGGKKHQSQM